MLRTLLLISILLSGCDAKVNDLSTEVLSRPFVEKLDKLAALPGETVTATGRNLTGDIRIDLDTAPLTWTLLSATEGQFAIPADTALTITKIRFIDKEKTISEIPLLIGEVGSSPEIALEPSSICDDTLFLNAEGFATRGERDCRPVPELCDEDGKLNCVAHSDFPAVKKEGLAAKIIKDLSVAGVSGTNLGPGQLLAVCTSSNQTGCRLEGTDVVAVKTSEVLPIDIRDSIVIAGVTGTLIEETSTVCTTDGQISCVTSADFPAIDKLTKLSIANKAKIHDSITIAGEQGTLGDCSSGGSDCFLPSFDGTSQLFKAIDFTSVTENVIKKNVVIAGVTGQYPSATYPLPGGDATLDLVSASFSSQLSNGSASFAWYDREGTRYTQLGTSDLDADNILDGKTIFGFNGNIALPAPRDVRLGTPLGVSTGKLITSCKNPAKLSTKNYGKPIPASWSNGSQYVTVPSMTLTDNQAIRFSHGGNGFTLNDRTTYYVREVNGNDFKISETSGGSTYIDFNTTRADVYIHVIDPAIPDEWDNLWPFTDYAQNPWGSASAFCGGLEATADDHNIWKDVSSGAQCTNGGDCRYKDKISGLTWTKVLSSSLLYSPAVVVCDSLNYDGVSGWRLPTLLEWTAAATHGMQSVANNNWISATAMTEYFMSSTMNAGDDVQYVSLRPSDFALGYEWKMSIAKHLVCVRE